MLHSSAEFVLESLKWRYPCRYSKLDDFTIEIWDVQMFSILGFIFGHFYKAFMSQFSRDKDPSWSEGETHQPSDIMKHVDVRCQCLKE